MAGVTKTLVESAVVALNDKAELLGMDRRFEFAAGSRANGVQHALIETQPTLVHPISQTKIGRSFAEAHTYLVAMNHALLAAIADRDHRRVSIHAAPTYDRVERDNQTDEPEAVDWDAYPHNQAG